MRRRARTSFSDLSASDLMLMMRAGDADALGELYVRYRRYAYSVARQSGSPEPDDAVAESFRLIARAVQSGGGPTIAFGPYLATTVRSVVQRQRIGAARLIAVDQSAIEGAAVADIESDPLLAAAFATLPERWQHVIWYVVIDDLLPTGLTFVSATPSNGGTCIDDTCEWAMIAAGTSVSVQIIVNVDPAITAGTVLTNEATVDSDTPDPNDDNNDDDHDTEVVTAADVSIVKVLTSGPLVPGTDARYTLTVNNAGPSAATAVVVTDTVPAGLTALAATSTVGTCSVTTSSVTCQLGTLTVGQTVTITVDVGVGASVTGNIVNLGEVESTTPDPDPTDNEDETDDPTTPSADVSVVKSGPATVTGHETATFGLVASNAGPSTAVGVVVTDTLPDGMTFLSASTGCSHASGVVSCTIGTLSVGQTVTVQVTVRIDNVYADVTLTNVATVTGTTPDPDPTNNDDEHDTVVEPAAGQVTGVVWHDIDGDGIQDAGEVGVPGVTVRIAGDPDGDGVPTIITVITGPDGRFTAPVAPGSWVITVDASTWPSGMAPTTATTYTVNVPPGGVGQVATGIADGTITGRVWADLDRDGVIDPGETDISGVTVRLVCPGPDGIVGTADDMVLSTVTQSPYTFTGVPIGQACVVSVDRSTLPANLRDATFEIDGALDGSVTVTVTSPGGVVDNVDFGYASPASSLPRTGSDTRLALEIAALTLVAGAGLAAIATRRRRHA